VGDHREAGRGGDRGAYPLQATCQEEVVEGGCVGEDHGGGELDEETNEHGQVVADVVD